MIHLAVSQTTLLVIKHRFFPNEYNFDEVFWIFFFTLPDSGLVVPSISYEWRKKLFEAAEKLGFKQERQIEMVGRSACEMVLQLLGGSTR